MTQEQITHFDGIFNALCTYLDITETQFDAVVRSYRAVGDWLAKSDSSLAPYKPLIRPQGSFLLGTMVRPINENDDLDIDLVCELTASTLRGINMLSNTKLVVDLRITIHTERCLRRRGVDAGHYDIQMMPIIIWMCYLVW